MIKRGEKREDNHCVQRETETRQKRKLKAKKTGRIDGE